MILTRNMLIGPRVTASHMKALGGPYATFYPKFKQGSDDLAARDSLDWYYDGMMNHYAASVAVSYDDPKQAAVYIQRANALGLRYINLQDRSTTPPQMINIWQMHAPGLAYRYLTLKDAQTFQTIKDMTTAAWFAWGQKSIFHAGIDLNDYWEPRYMGRLVDLFTIAYHLRVPTPGAPIAEGTWMEQTPAWDALARQIIIYTARCQNADGAWRSSNYEGQQAAYNAGILLNSMVDAVRLLPTPPPELIPMIHKGVAFQSTQWVPDKGFQYGTGPWANGSTAVANDVTGIIIPSIAWSAKNGGVVSTDFVEEVFAQSMRDVYLAGGKQFNQGLVEAYRVAGLLHP